MENLLASRITLSDNGTISRSLAFEAVKVEGVMLMRVVITYVHCFKLVYNHKVDFNICKETELVFSGAHRNLE